MPRRRLPTKASVMIESSYLLFSALRASTVSGKGSQFLRESARVHTSCGSGSEPYASPNLSTVSPRIFLYFT
jgi:hypothetical protein